MKLTRRRVWVTATVFMIVAVVLLVVLTVFCGDRITQANVDRIQDGMSLKQVCEILGPPTDLVDKADHRGTLDFYQWQGKRGMARVTFQNDGVISRFFRPDDWWSQTKALFGY